MIRDSMLFWYPKVKDLPIPQPKTEILKLSKEERSLLVSENVPLSIVVRVKKVCDKMGYPCFLRTDLASGKHQWKDSCYIENDKDLQKHIFEVVCFNLCADIMGLDFWALVVREFIQMDTYFTAFWGEMPVNPERRYFIKNHQVICHHCYWIPEAIEQSKAPIVDNWRELCELMKFESNEEVALLIGYTKIIAEVFDGYWSVDFCKAKKDGRWIFIDMATGERSWHPVCHKAMFGEKK